MAADSASRTGGTVDDVIADAVAALRLGLPELNRRVSDAVAAAVPVVAEDPDLQRSMLRSVDVNVTDALALLGDPELPVDSGVPPEAVGFATLLVRRGLDPGDLAHAYLAGQNELLRAWMVALSERLTGPELVHALDRSSSRVFARVDFLVTQLIRHVDRERERWMGSALARRTELVQDLLDGVDASVGEASRALGYDLDRWVLALILWHENGDGEVDGEMPASHDRLEALAAAAAEAAGAARALTLPPGGATLWAWIATAARPDLDRVTAALELREDEGVALGTPGHALEGFRVGHLEARLARRVAELGDRGGAVRYDQVEAVALASADLAGLDRFVARTLGPLAADDESTRRLRETLLAWLATGGNARRAAEQLHAHKNTVLYRLQRAQQLMGRPLDENRGALELALGALDRLGPRGSWRED